MSSPRENEPTPLFRMFLMVIYFMLKSASMLLTLLSKTPRQTNKNTRTSSDGRKTILTPLWVIDLPS